jgi:phage baseplate assembly protein W
MAKLQKYGIKYPFTSNNNDEIFLDVNDTALDGVKSQVLHVLFTPKGQKLRDPEFGTDLIKYIFSNGDNDDLSGIKSDISKQIKKFVKDVDFRDIKIYKDENDANSMIVIVEYGVKVGNDTEITTVGVKLS